MKPIIRNEHREAFAAGDLDQIPPRALELLLQERAIHETKETNTKETNKKTNKAKE